MAFQLSPGVNVTEIDLTTVVPAVATSTGAIAGLFRWGPVGTRFMVDSETKLIARFGKPTNYNSETFFTAANFLSYSNSLYVVRAANTTGSTPVAGVTPSRSANSLTASGGTQYTNTDYITIVSQYGVNATANVSTNSTGGTLVLTITNPGSGINATPTVSAFAANGAVSNGGSTATFTVVSNTTNTVVLLSGNAQQISTDMYVTQTSNTAATSTGKTVAVNSVVANLITLSTPVTGNTTLYFGRNGTSYSAVGFDPSSANAFVANLANQIVANTDAYLAVNGNFDSDVLYVAKYPGDIGNTLRISVCDTANAFTSNVTYATNLVFTIGSNTATAEFTGTSNAAANVLQYSVGDKILAGNSSIGYQYLQLTALSVNTSYNSNTLLTMQFQDPYRLYTAYSTNTVPRYWEFYNTVDGAPGISPFVNANGNTAAKDELHVVVVDDNGLFTGVPGTILETYKGLSRATDAKNADGTSTNYYKEVINQNSAYIWWANDRSGAASANAALVTSSTNYSPANMQLVLGADGYNSSSSNSYAVIASAYDLFASAEDIDISLILQGRPLGAAGSSYQLANYLIDNIAEIRKDCVVFVSPDSSLMLNSFGTEAANIVAWRNSVHSSSYAVMDSGYKYQYDKYNDIYRWIPLNGDIAGLCARTDQTNDAWWSPAGFNRGQIKNLVKLAYNPKHTDRDTLYKNGVNPVVSFPGQGTVLYGDKTLQAKPSAFDRINVRRLFIVLEKAISTAAKYSLFEFNDAFTRSQFKNLISPYLRTIQGRRGITDFLVVCDDTNNTAQIIDTNQFIGDIYIKPARSINFIQLNFVAVGTGVQFSEVVGKF